MKVCQHINKRQSHDKAVSVEKIHVVYSFRKRHIMLVHLYRKDTINDCCFSLSNFIFSKLCAFNRISGTRFMLAFD